MWEEAERAVLLQGARQFQVKARLRVLGDAEPERWRGKPALEWYEATLEWADNLKNVKRKDWDWPVLPTRGALNAFVRLADGDDKSIVAFAEKYGALGLCACWRTEQTGYVPGRPVSTPAHACPKHASLAEFAPSSAIVPLQDRLRLGLSEGPYSQLEPLELWRERARQVAGVLRVARYLHRSSKGQRQGHDRVSQDWADALRVPLELLVSRRRSGSRVAYPRRFLLGRVVDILLQEMKVEVRFRWRGQSPELGLISTGRHNVLGEVVRQLALRVMFTPEGNLTAVRCANCGGLFAPSRRPRANELSWCRKEECRYAARAHAQWRYRHGLATPRKKAKRKRR